jgi:hypothetical protein
MLAAIPPFAGASGALDERTTAHSDHLAFVGRIVGIEEMGGFDCDGCISFDQVFVARYEVLQTLRGHAPDSPISFHVFDHGSFPDFAETRTALMFLHRDVDHWVLDRYQGFAVDRTSDGRWATCRAEPDADDLEAMASGDAPRLPAPEAIEFAADVVFDDVSRWSPDEVAERYPSPTYAVHDGRVTCTRGTYVEDFVDAMEAWRASPHDRTSGS